MRNTLMGGRGAGLAAAAGAALGNSSHATAAFLGVAVVFARWPVLLTVLRVAGAAYLAWLGAVSVMRAWRYHDGGLSMPGGARLPGSRRSALRQGLTVNVLNPTIATFYLVVVPSFVYAGAPIWYFVMLAAIHVIMAFTCHGVWALGLHRVRHLLQPPWARRLLEAGTGVALLALAALVLTTGVRSQ